MHFFSAAAEKGCLESFQATSSRVVVDACRVIDG
jgi:hypothetical protein